MLVEVKNINGTSQDRYKNPPARYSSQIDYWRKGTNTNELIIPCSNKSCGRRAEVGGHVIKVGSEDRRWYITPLCRSCNSKRNESFLVESDRLVPINS